MPTVIAKNTTTLDMILEDLGIIIPGSSIIDLTETYEFYEITSSKDLKTQISNGNIIINDSIQDLSVENSLKHVGEESIYEDELKVHRIVDNEESTTYSTSWVEKLKRTIDLELGNYLLVCSYEIKSNTNDVKNYCQGRVRINDSNDLFTNMWPYAKYQSFSGTDSIGLISGLFSVQVDFRRQGVYQPVYIRNVVISLAKL